MSTFFKPAGAPEVRRRLTVLVVAVILSPAVVVAAGARLYKSGPIQITADGRYVWVANEDNDSVARIDTSNDDVLEIVLPDTAKFAPRGLSVLEDGSEVWVACHDADAVCVLSGDDGALIEQIPLPWGSGPYSVALSRDQSRALVTLHRAAGLAVLDVASRAVSHVLEPTFWSPMGIAWTEDGASAWVTHLFAPGEHPFLTRVDFSGALPKVATQIQVFATDPRHSGDLAAPHDIAEGGYLTVRGHPAQIPSATGRDEIWLPTQYNNISEDVYSPDSTVQSTIRRLDLASRRIPNANTDKVILSAVHIHDPGGSNPYIGPGWNAGVAGPIDIAFSADGSMTYLLHELSNDLVILPSSAPNVKPAAASPLPEVAVGHRPMGLAVSPQADVAYVYNRLSRDVSVVDLGQTTELRRIPVTPLTGEPFSPTVLTGARIFHTSDDPRISSNQKVACASCHINAEHDGRTWAFHRLPGTHGPREVPSLLGLSLTMGPLDPTTGFGQLHRSGDRDEIQDFEHTFQGINMGGSGFLAGGVQPELGPPNAGRSAGLDALADYLLFLEPVRRSPHRDDDGSLSEAAVRGATFFVGNNRATKPADAGCATCHVPETGFVDFKFHDVGSSRPSSEQELNSRVPAWHVNTPTLVGVWTTPHFNGSSGFAPSMVRLLQDQASRAASATPHGSPDGLTNRQLADLAEFVLSIDGDMTAAEARAARDTTPPRIIRVEAASLSLVDVWFSETVQRAPASDPANWRLEKLGGGTVAITAAVRDDQNGDRVTLTTRLEADSTYRLAPVGSILDAADSASGGVANALDLGDLSNTHDLVIGDSLTITLGASGYENLTIPVHDASMVGPGLSTWSHDSVWLFPVNSGPGVNTGFVRFDWRDRLLEATGIASADHILDASFTLHAEMGDAAVVEIRRVLKPWSDPPSGGDWNRNANGAPTWRDHAHPSSRWNSSGAGSLGGTGDSVADYNGSRDLAARVDAVVAMDAINEKVTFGGASVTEAFRFWFDNPSVDYGYALRLTPAATQETKFARNESGFRNEGPVLRITYDLADVVVVTRETVIREGDIWRFFRGTTAPPSDWNETAFDASNWESGPTGIGYGDNDDNTVLDDMQCPGGENCTESGYLAFFARKEFDLPAPGNVVSATLTVSYDDGFVAYVNGVEVGRVNMPSGPVTEATAAAATVGNAPDEPDAVIQIPTEMLRPGANVLAASVHNAGLSSSDASFIPELEIVRRGTSSDGRFQRSDCNADGSRADVSDAVFLLRYNFAGSREPPCLAACDVNGDGRLTGQVTDAIHMLLFTFARGAPPVPPFPDCGPAWAPSDEELGCATPPAECN